jgi:exosortase
MTQFTRLGAGAWALAALAASVAAVYGQVLLRLAQDWRTDDNYSHGFLILPLAAYFAFERRNRLAALLVRPQTVLGGLVVSASLALLAAGTLGSEFFLTRISFVGALAGSVLFLYGVDHLRLLAFPLAFLFLMIPIPAILFNQVAFPLQLLASRVGEDVMTLAGVPVLREGNVIVLATTTLEVAEACSGIRSLISLLTLGIVLGYFMDTRPAVRVGLAIATIPLAIATNALRVAGTGIAAHYWSPQIADGFFHTFSGWLVFGTALVLLLAVAQLLRKLLPDSPRGPAGGPSPQYS